MKRELVLWELRKLLSVPMFSVFLLICVCFNCFLILSDRYGNDGGDYVSYISEVTAEARGQMGAEFDLELEKLPSSRYKDMLISETYGKADILEDYDTAQIAGFYMRHLQITGAAAGKLENKFFRLQESVRRLADSDASMSLAAAGMTKPLLNGLFNTLCRVIITEGMILAVLLALYSCGCEGIFRTDATVYSSKTGRAVQKSKLAASAVASLAAYGLLAIVSVSVFALVWRLGPIWSASMSSQFYYVGVMGMAFPFLSWTPFTVGGYLAATLLLGAAVVLVFHLMGFSAGLLAGNTYYGFLLCFLFAALEFGVLMLSSSAGFWLLYMLLQWTPIPLWWGQNLWFTGLDFGTLIPYQECWTALFCLALLTLLIVMLYRRFYKKDVMEHAA